MSTFRLVLLAGILLPCQLAATFTFASPQPQDEMNFTLEGKITERSPGKLTVATGENMIFHVIYNDKTEIKKADGTPGAPQDLRIGSRISVAGDLAESGEITAKQITIEAADGGNKK